MRTPARLLLCLLTSLTLTSAETAHPPHNTLSPDEKAAGWKLLFDGKSLAHWRNYQEDQPNEKWQVFDGYFALSKPKGGNLITRERYSQFELILDYKVSFAGNSGVMFHVQETEEHPWMTGPEAQILDNRTALYEKNKAGWLYDLVASKKDSSHEWGQWNTLRLVITEAACTHYLNGVKYLEYVKGGREWNKLVSQSKFRDLPLFGTFAEGHICLQDHGKGIAFRNVKIRKIGE